MIMKTKRHITALLFGLAACSAVAQTTGADSSQTQAAANPVVHELRALVRTTSNSVTLRWAPDDYVAWKLTQPYGYSILRVSFDKREGATVDTLAECRPISLDEFKTRFPATDSLAAAAAQVVWGASDLTLDRTKSRPQNMGSVFEVADQQQNIYSYAMVVAEQRLDLAEAMGLAYTDRKVEPGRQYDYVIVPLVPDSIIHHRREAIHDVVVQAAPRPAFGAQLTDSILGPHDIMLAWPDLRWSFYDIEWRAADSQEWHKANQRPYMSMERGDEALPDTGSVYVHRGMQPGSYVYRVYGYDAFGERTLPSEEHSVTLPDLVPPEAAHLWQIEILREQKTNLPTQAVLRWKKETQEPDLAGFLPCYFNQELLGDQWRPLTDSLLSPRDSVATVDIQGLKTGLVTIACYDTNGNMNHSLPMQMIIADLVPPLPPTRLRSVIDVDGNMTMAWHPSRSIDADHYEIYMANDSTHEFALVNDRVGNDTIYTEQIQLDLAQRHRYYKIKTVDKEGNSSEFSEMHVRYLPNFIPPTACVLDTIWVEEPGRVHAAWLPSPQNDIDYYNIYRRLESDMQWTLLRSVSADSLDGNHRVALVDEPAYSRNDYYQYAVESVNETGVSSGMSLYAQVQVKGPQTFPVRIKLDGVWHEQDGKVMLGWGFKTEEVEAISPDYYTVVLRKGTDDDEFKFMRTIRKGEEPVYTDNLLTPGDKAQYLVRIRFKDGRTTDFSNMVEVERPDK